MVVVDDDGDLSTKSIIVNNAGNMGIGVTSPNERLDVGGNAIIGYPGNRWAFITTPPGFSDPKLIIAALDTVTDEVDFTHGFVMTAEGNIGVNDPSPQATFSVRGTFRAGDISDVDVWDPFPKCPTENTLLHRRDKDWVAFVQNYYYGGKGLRVKGGYYKDTDVPLFQVESNHFYQVDVVGSAPPCFESNIIFVVKSNGQVVVGDDMVETSDHYDNYKFSVDGKILTNEIVVVGITEFEDYVLSEEYDLISLEELGAFIKKNGHLPDVPTEEEVIKKGINLGEMDGILLKKIEELTLYLMEQNKQIELLKKENEEFKEKIVEINDIK